MAVLPEYVMVSLDDPQELQIAVDVHVVAWDAFVLADSVIHHLRLTAVVGTTQHILDRFQMGNRGQKAWIVRSNWTTSCSAERHVTAADFQVRIDE